MRSWIIGSAPECDLSVSRPTVSERHCCLIQTAPGFVLQDLRSTNGTFVNGTRITSLVRVSPGDTITMGLAERMPWPSLVGEPTAATIHIGREEGNDVVLDYPMISSYHARILRAGNGAVIEDLGSANGTFLGAHESRITRCPLMPTDAVFLGSFRISAAELLAGDRGRGTAAQHTLAFQGHEMVLGRNPDCDQVLDYPMVSGRHARLVRTGTKLFVEDLGSSNGTYVNGRRIREAVAVGPGDVVGLGSFTVALKAAGQLEVSNSRDNLTIEAREVAVDVPGRRLLEGISLTIHPSEFVGLMGPSGAGKSTLMNALNGYSPPSKGMVLLNGQDLYANYARFQGQLGYVPQEDIIHRDLTVGQALYYTARLRLPSDFADAEIRNRVRAVLAQLGLESTEGVPVGSPEKKGISGGQRKRVNLAMELLTDPSVLFLDEPTSGLSSEDTLMVMRLLRRLADGGKTILLTIHQPSLEAFRLMDNLALVAKDSGSSDPGRLVYFGPAYPDAVRFFNPNGVANARPGVEPSPDEVLRGLTKAKTVEWAEAYARSTFRRDYVQSRAGRTPSSTTPHAAPAPRRGDALAQWWTLVRRSLAIKVKDAWNSAILLAQAPIIAALIVLVFGNEARETIPPNDFAGWSTAANAVSITIFDLVLAAIWFGCSNSAREFVAERAIYQRERMVNLRITSYVASKFAVLGAFCCLQCAVLLCVVSWGSGLKGPWLPMFGVLLLASEVGLAVGLVVSALARTSEVAVALVPLMILPMLILGGAMQPIHKMNAVMKPVSFIMPSRLAFEGLLVLEAGSRPNYEPPRSLIPALPGSGHQEPKQRGQRREDMAEGWFPAETERIGVGACVLALGGMFVLLIGAILAILRQRDIN